jgi:hypothetical protein
MYTDVSVDRAALSSACHKDGGGTFFRNVGKCPPHYTASHSRRQHSSLSLPESLRSHDVELLYTAILLVILFANCEWNSTSISSDGHIMNNLKRQIKEKNNKKTKHTERERERKKNERKLLEFLRSKSVRNPSVLLQAASVVTTS